MSDIQYMPYEKCIDLGVDHILKCCKNKEKKIADYCRASREKNEGKIFEMLKKSYPAFKKRKPGFTRGGFYARVLSEYMDIKGAGWEITEEIVRNRVEQWRTTLLRCIEEALKGRSGKPARQMREAEKYVIADVHGSVRGMIQMFWILGVIRGHKFGFVFKNWRKVISVGDLVDRGPHSMEAILLLLAVQLGAEQIRCGEIVRLIGNHEMGKMWDDSAVSHNTLGPLDHAILRILFHSDIGNGKVQIADYIEWNGHPIVLTHAGVRKNVLEKYAAGNGITIQQKGSSTLKVQDYYEAFKAQDVVDWLNDRFQKDAKAGKFDGKQERLDTVNSTVLYGTGKGPRKSAEKEKSASVVWTRYSQTKDPNKPFASKPITLDKPIQLVGHTIVSAGIVRRNNIFFIDTGLHSNGSQEFVAINNEGIHSVKNAKSSKRSKFDLYEPINAGNWSVSKLHG